MSAADGSLLRNCLGLMLGVLLLEVVTEQIHVRVEDLDEAVMED